MPVDSDAASLDTFPTNVVVINDPLPPTTSDASASTVTEVLVIIHDGASGGAGQDPLLAAMWDLSPPIAADANDETPEACHVALLDNASKLATMRHLTEAYQREIDQAVCGTPAAGEPSRMGTVRQRSAAIAS
ncbi:hypothetical protein ACQJBY_032623 [Aegilops geniculata]